MSNDPDKKNLPQVRPNANIALASKQLATVNKVLTTINREKFIKFLARNKGAAEFFINLICHYSNVLDRDLIEQHANQWDWGKYGLSSNESLPWSEAFIERYKDKWDWHDGLSENKSLPWSEAFIERYADKWSELLIGRNQDDRWIWYHKFIANGAVIKLFNNWTKQEISTALERIRSAHKDLPHV